MYERDKARLTELGRFLKSRRAMLKPETLGLAPTRRRRTPGLRREEIADVAGISPAWYIRLEQGRDVRASIPTLDRIARALRLDASEQAYLLELARPDLDWKSAVRSHEMPTPMLLAMVSGLMPHPAYVLNKYWQVKACNLAARLLLGDLDNEAEWGANLIMRLFQDERMRERFVDWPVVVRSVVAQLRLSTAAMANDPIMGALVTQLRTSSPEFKKLWEASEVSEAPIWRKALAHPAVGRLNFDFAAFSPPGTDSGFTLAIHTPSDETTRTLLGKLIESEPNR